MQHSPVGAHPLPGMRPLWPAVTGKFVSKRAAIVTFQRLAELTAVDSQVTGHACRVTGAQAMAVAGVDVCLIQAFWRWGSRAVLECIRDCHLTSVENVSRKVTHGLRLMEVREHSPAHGAGGRPGSSCGVRTDFRTSTGRQSSDGDWRVKHGNTKDQIEQGMKKNTREDKTKFVVCAGAACQEPHNMLVWTSMDSSGGEDPVWSMVKS